MLPLLAIPPLFNRGSSYVNDVGLLLDLLCSIVALQEFTLVAAQQDSGSTGGLRDKPGK